MKPSLCLFARPWMGAFAALGVLSSASAFAADRINGEVTAAGAPVVGATVTLWAAGTDAPRQLAQSRTAADGRFALSADGKGAVLYLVAKGGRSAASKAGDNPALALISVLNTKPPPKVAINEMTTVASVWTHNQFIDGTAIKGNALSLKIAAGNVPSFVDLQTGGWGSTIQDSLNSGQT